MLWFPDAAFFVRPSQWRKLNGPTIVLGCPIVAIVGIFMIGAGWFLCWHDGLTILARAYGLALLGGGLIMLVWLTLGIIALLRRGNG